MVGPLYIPGVKDTRFEEIGEFAQNIANQYAGQMASTSKLVNSILLRKAFESNLKQTAPYVTPDGKRAMDIINKKTGALVKTIELPPQRIEKPLDEKIAEKKALTEAAESVKKPYRVGSEVERKEGQNIVTYQVEGYDENNKPIFNPVSTSPRFKDEGGGVPTLGQVKAKVMDKWLNNENLNPKESRVLRKIFGEKTDEEILGRIKLRWRGKVQAFEQEFGRKPNSEELRKMFINDPFGMLESSGGGMATQPGTSDKNVNDFINKWKTK